MLVHVVSLGGVAVSGSKDIMAVSRAWGTGFAGLRRLQSFRPVWLSGAWSHPTLEPMAQHRLSSSRHLRFAHAAALEDSPDLHHKRGGRLSRAERYALVENFVLRHKDTHEGKWPSVSSIIKEIGGSRLIVKDIVDELEKNSMAHSQSMENNGQATYTEPLAIIGDEEVATQATESEELQEVLPVEAEASHSLVEDLNPTETPSEPSIPSEPSVLVGDETLSSSGPSKPISREIETDPGLWRRLRNLGQHDSHSEPKNVYPDYDYDYTESEDEDDPSVSGAFERPKGSRQQDVSENHSKSLSGRYQPQSTTGGNYGMFIRFLPLSATEGDLRASFQDCGEIVRAQAMVPKGAGLKFTYGFVDFSTPEALAKALRKDKVFIKGSAILTEACSGSRRTDGRKLGPDLSKKSENRISDRSVDGLPVNGARSSFNKRLKRTDSHTVVDNGFKSSTGSYLVAVEGLPYPMPISAVEKMLSAHGDIYRSELTREDGGTYSAHVEFKTEEARDSALASSRVYLGGRWCRISTGEPILTTVVRLSNVGNASEYLILQRCEKIGRVDSIVQRKEGVVDVYYHPNERRNMRKILDRLGEVNADFKRWHANLAPKCTLEEIRNSAEIQDWVEMQKDRLLDNLTGAMKLMIIDLEDLRELVDSDRRHLSGKRTNFNRSPEPKPNRS